MTTTETTRTYTLRLQSAIVEEMRKVAEEEGATLDQLINVAVAEKLAALRDVAYFEQRAKGANREAFRAFLETGGGNEPPIVGDELPEGWVSRRRT